MGHGQTIALLMGPTASGKSAAALKLAQAQPAVIINADAMQLVDTLRVLTARPTAEDEAQAEHALYGILPTHEPTSVARWLALVEPVIRRAWAEGKLPLVTGGTGMYVKALMEGIARIPPIPEALRGELRAAYPDAVDGRLHAALAAVDPVMAAKLKPGDTQRLLRALEVVRATGHSLAYWQQLSRDRLFPEAGFACFKTELPRDTLYARIDARFDQLMAQGALEEVRALLNLDLPPDTPILRAHGAPELAAHLRGEMPLDAAIAHAKQNTRHYAKRQLTWLRNQLPGAVAVSGNNLHKVFT